MRRDYAWGWCTKDGVQKESMQKCTVYLLGIFKTTGGVLKDDGQDLDGGKQMTSEFEIEMTILICFLTVVQIAILVQQIMMERELKKLLAEFRSVQDKEMER
ncbi:MAG TPA: hypothetical protein DCP98_08395 [Sphaerochaeta sp.]|nr:hypothetical protein [Sphaerochaeta sp.]